ncbi:MAG: ribosomal protein S18-alanine N-acetyltransferase [Nitrospirae bacterium]|nr:ribosomal protein S18-alanine N-acetyltransferase [Nitrospirota bacterium]
MEGIKLRRMTPADLPQVLAIETECFSSPWSIRSFKFEIEQSESIFKTAVLDEQVVGYVCLRTMLDITHVMNLAVLPQYRRKGIGIMLLKDALLELRRLRPDIKFVTLEVRESSGALKLYEKAGFAAIGKRKGYYHSPDEDAIIMGMEIVE